MISPKVRITQGCIDDQKAVIAALEDGTLKHRVASQILLMMQQWREIDEAISALEEQAEHGR